MFTIKTTQKLLRTSGDPAQEMIDSQVMGPEALEEHLMDQGMVQLVASQMETVVMEQDQLGLQAMALEKTVGIPAPVLLMAVTLATALVMEQVQATVAAALTVVLSLTLLL